MLGTNTFGGISVASWFYRKSFANMAMAARIGTGKYLRGYYRIGSHSTQSR